MSRQQLCREGWVTGETRSQLHHSIAESRTQRGHEQTELEAFNAHEVTCPVHTALPPGSIFSTPVSMAGH